TITIQNYFRLYQKLAGMTGTAETEANEFHDIYKLDVLVIPTNRPVARKDSNDRIYKTRREKYNAVINEIKECHAKAQPVLVGTERHESRRIDRQLRGRCARQGDPGASRFYVSFEDDLMRNFGAADRMMKIMERFGLEEGQELEHPWLNKSVETAQKRVEQR